MMVWLMELKIRLQLGREIIFNVKITIYLLVEDKFYFFLEYCVQTGRENHIDKMRDMEANTVHLKRSLFRYDIL